MASTDIAERKAVISERHLRGQLNEQRRKARALGPDVLVKTSREGRPFRHDDLFNLDFDVEYSLNKQNRWELPAIIADQLPRYDRATLANVRVKLAQNKKEQEKLEQSKRYDTRYHLKGAAALEYAESRDGELTKKKLSKSGKTQLRTLIDPLKFSRPHDMPEETRVICVCGKCKTPKEHVVDYTVVRYTATCKDGDEKHWRTRIKKLEEDDRAEEEQKQQFVAYVPKKRKNEMRRLKHAKHLYSD